MNDIINSDGIEITPSEATELCVHHLRLAFTFYLSSEGIQPWENLENLRAEFHRQCVTRGMTKWGLDPIWAFIEAAVKGDEGPDHE